jgi:hypothetical protein
VERRTIINWVLHAITFYNCYEDYKMIIPPVCSICGAPMENAIDRKTKEVSPYLWKTTCGHNNNLILSIG